MSTAPMGPPRAPSWALAQGKSVFAQAGGARPGVPQGVRRASAAWQEAFLARVLPLLVAALAMSCAREPASVAIRIGPVPVDSASA